MEILSVSDIPEKQVRHWYDPCWRIHATYYCNKSQHILKLNSCCKDFLLYICNLYLCSWSQGFTVQDVFFFNCLFGSFCVSVTGLWAFKSLCGDLWLCGCIVSVSLLICLPFSVIPTLFVVVLCIFVASLHLFVVLSSFACLCGCFAFFVIVEWTRNGNLKQMLGLIAPLSSWLYITNRILIKTIMHYDVQINLQERRHTWAFSSFYPSFLNVWPTCVTPFSAGNYCRFS